MDGDRRHIAAAPAGGGSLGRTLLLGLYAVVILAPLALTIGTVKPGAQGRIVVFADAIGFVALSMIALQVIASGRWATTTLHFGLRRILALHRQAGMAVLLLVVGHVVILVADDPGRLALFDIGTAPGRARAGILALLGLIGLAWTSVARARLNLSYERWRGLHLGLTSLVIAASFVHVVSVHAYTSLPLVREVVLILTLGAMVALFWARVGRPYATALRPYRIKAVHPERGNAVTLELTADGHRGLRFGPGQFARLRPAHAPYSLDDHPFTLSSSAERPDSPSFTVKALGDFSASIAELRAGEEVLVDGPHGEAAHDRRGGRGRLLLAAGIGITPAMSVLRTAAERGDHRPHLLLYGSRHWHDVTFREELSELEHRLPALRVVHVLSRPQPGWQGEEGRVDQDLLRRYAPEDITAWSALICGPPAMVDEISASVLGLGVPASAIQAEGFE
ncbi:MAG: ferric reductase-like transmembrane domain-containing protein [Solirubrobacteraceae bacterium]